MPSLSDRSPLPLTLCLFLIFSCNNPNPAHDRPSVVAALQRCAAEYHIEGLTYLIGQDGRLTAEYSSRPGAPEIDSSQSILTHFLAPLALDRAIRDSLLHEQDSVTPWLRAKDLVSVPASYYERAPTSPDVMTTRIQTLLAKRHAPAPSGLPTPKPRQSLSSLLRDIWKIATWFDNSYPEYNFSSSSVYNVYPTWYTRGLSEFFGWKILKFQRQTVLWNSFSDKNNGLLVMKFVDKNTFVAIGYPTGRLPSPTDLNQDDLLRSPLALSVLTALYLKGPPVDYNQPPDSLYARLEEQMRSSYNFIYLHDLLAHARLYQQQGLTTQAAGLYNLQKRLTKDSLLAKYENTPVLAGINYVSDQLKATVPFTLGQASALRVFAGGQLRPDHDYNDNSYVFDNVQIFINDHAGEKDNSWLNTHLFQFNYGASLSRWTTTQCATGDASDTSYFIEARIPWQALNPSSHAPGRKILANILISDCDLDEDQRKSVLSWAVNPNENFADEKKYGQIMLTSHPRAPTTNPTTQYAFRTPQPPVIDGKPEALWDKAPWSTINLPYMGSTTPKDNAGRFKGLYDDSCLYLLFEVTDNCKNPYGLVTTDKCWIEDAATGLPVWKMTGSRTGAFPGFFDSRRILLPAGKYLLKYASDKGHSYEYWYGQPPANGLYGASVYLAQQ